MTVFLLAIRVPIACHLQQQVAKVLLLPIVLCPSPIPIHTTGMVVMDPKTVGFSDRNQATQARCCQIILPGILTDLIHMVLLMALLPQACFQQSLSNLSLSQTSTPTALPHRMTQKMTQPRTHQFLSLLLILTIKASSANSEALDGRVTATMSISLVPHG